MYKNKFLIVLVSVTILNLFITACESQAAVVYPRKTTFRVGDTVAFSFDTDMIYSNSYFEIRDPQGTLYWRTDTFPYSKWIQVDTRYYLPFFEQTAGGNPMILLDDAPQGTWTWTYYNADKASLTSGSFTVAPPVEDIIGQQVEDLNQAASDLQSQITEIDKEILALRNQITNTANSANSAVQAANAATQAINSVAQTSNAASIAANKAAVSAQEAQKLAENISTLVYGAIGGSLISGLLALLCLNNINSLKHRVGEIDFSQLNDSAGSLLQAVEKLTDKQSTLGFLYSLLDQEQVEGVYGLDDLSKRSGLQREDVEKILKELYNANLLLLGQDKIIDKVWLKNRIKDKMKQG